MNEFADLKALITWGLCSLNYLPAALITPCSACVTHPPLCLTREDTHWLQPPGSRFGLFAQAVTVVLLDALVLGLNPESTRKAKAGEPKGTQRKQRGGTFVLLGQLVSHVPVLVAAQDVVGDVDVAGSHVVDALGNGDGPRRGRAGAARAAPSRADRGRAQGHGRGGFCAPARGRERVSPSHTPPFHCCPKCT